MSKRYISANDFTGAVTSIIKSWETDVAETTDDIIREVANESRDKLKIEGDFKDRSGKYRKGWKVTFTETRFGLQATVHNKVYQLTHLLESGHAKWLWGRDTGDTVKAFPHIEKVNEETQKKLVEELARRLEEL